MDRRIQTTRLYDPVTGRLTSARTAILAPAGFPDRIAQLKTAAIAALQDAGPVEGLWCRLECNGCGTTAGLDYDQPVYPEGWQPRADGDFCPACAWLISVLARCGAAVRFGR